MAKPTQRNKPLTPPVTEERATTMPPKQETTGKRGNHPPPFLFDSTNYKWMMAGVVLILLGFALMSGGKSANLHEFHYDEIYSFRRVTLAPLVVLLGFAVEFYAIMRKPTFKS